MSNLKGKKAIVTGASRGIGKEIAVSLAEMGAEILVVYNKNDKEAQNVKEKIEKIGSVCHTIKVDLQSADCADVIFGSFPAADIIVHNASVQIRNEWDKITADEFEKQINCNLRSVLLITQKYVNTMKEKKWGRIITIGSVQEKKPNPQMLVYSSSKCALTAMARAISSELAPFNITVNSVAPGIILTDRNKEALSNKEYYDICLKKVPAGRFGYASDLSGIVSLLCSDEGAYITGQNIYVDGGMGSS